MWTGRQAGARVSGRVVLRKSSRMPLACCLAYLGQMQAGAEEGAACAGWVGFLLDGAVAGKVARVRWGSGSTRFRGARLCKVSWSGVI